MDGFVQEKPNIDEYFLIRRISRGEKWHEVWIFVEGSRSRKLDFPNICNLSPSIFQLYITIIWTIWYAMLLIHFSCYLLTKAISPVLRLWVSHLFFSCSIGHFRVPKTLTFKMRLGAQSFFWKWVLFAWEWKMISISKAEHLPSFWNRGPRELGNGLLDTVFWPDMIK